MSIKTSQAILKCSLRWAQMTKTCLVTLEFFDFVKFTKNIELPAIWCFENLDRQSSLKKF